MPAIRPATQVGARVRTMNHGLPVEGTLRNKGIRGDLWLIQTDDGDCFWAGIETVEVVPPRMCCWGGCRLERGHDGAHFGKHPTEQEALANLHESSIE